MVPNKPRIKEYLEEDANLTHQWVASKLKKSFDVEKFTKKFYDRFKKEHATFLGFIQGITVQDDREWYTSVMLNRLMFIYFIQRQGFLDTKSKHMLDGERNYLRQRLEMSQKLNGPDAFHSFYRSFLLRFFHEGLNAHGRTPELEQLLGNVPYLNGGIFDIHQLEHTYLDIQIPDQAFERVFDFFDEFTWHLDNRLDKAGNEITPDVLGYIFEKHINQKQMGAYYTKEDITEYISKNTIIPFLFESTGKQCPIAFTPDGPVWSLLCDNPDDYIHQAVAKGIKLLLPREIEAGIADVSQRSEWNKTAAQEYALPTEIWREVVERRKRYEEIREKIVTGAITSINDLITYNLDIGQFAQDSITCCEGPDLLLAFYESIEKVKILDPTCGSGDFLFAALNILKPLYEACLIRMQTFVDEHDQLDKSIELHKRKNYSHIERFRDILKHVARYYSREYFILKSIMINNLYGVDIMEEAIEICKLRLFLKLVAQVEKPDDIEPLPDIDFNVLAGNTLVGFTSLDEVRSAIGKGLSMQAAADEILQRIEQKAQELGSAVEYFRTIQTTDEIELDRSTSAQYKQEVRNKLDALRSELDPYLAMEYGIDRNNIPSEQDYQQKYEKWLKNHQPFHWFVEFYGIITSGGFDVIIGNPPYIEYSKVRQQYTVRGYQTDSCGNLYAATIERSLTLNNPESSYMGLIVPLSICGSERFDNLRSKISLCTSQLWLSNFEIFPSKLFEGAFQRLTIALAKNKKAENESYVTKIQRWYASERAHLIDTLTYSATKQVVKPQVFPKLTSSIQEIILQKVQHKAKGISLAMNICPQKTDHFVYYQEATNYWMKATCTIPFYRKNGIITKPAHGRFLYFKESLPSRIVMALMNSSLFYVWFATYSDGFHLSHALVKDFPSGNEIYAQNELVELSIQLEQDIKINAKRGTRNTKPNTKSPTQKEGDLIEIEEYRMGFSKPLLDEIDHVLAKHYGFTDEELDFIINYDIKYRMGRDNGEEGEE
ncbi:MAG TPA: DNA methyltransferase [Ktedonobacteraceae bacterium]|jgi:hypothetical protein